MGIGTLDVILYERTVERALCYFGWFKVEVVGGLIEHPAFVIRDISKRFFPLPPHLSYIIVQNIIV